MEDETYYFNQHMLLFKDVLEEIINYENNQYYDRDYPEDRDFNEHGRYIYNDDDYSNDWNNDDEKLYGFTDCWETYWDSIYG